MAHELDTLADGVTAAYVGRQSAWHELGTVIPDRAITFTEALQLGGAAYAVDTRPIYTAHSVNGDADDMFYKEVAGYQSTFRTDTDATLGVVGKRYTPLQNVEAFGTLEPLVDAGTARIETAGTLRGGADVWLLVRFELEDPEVRAAFTERADGDTIQPYALITNNHTGARQAMILETPIRVVCANTLASALSIGGKARGFRSRHTMNVASNVADGAKQLFGSLESHFAGIAKRFDALRRTHLDNEMFRKLVLDSVAPIPEKLEASVLTTREQTSRAQVLARRERVALLWDAGDGHKGDRSAWEAYNGAVQSLDHDTDLWRSGTDERRLRSMFEGRLGEMKQAVFSNLSHYAEANAEA